MGKLEMSKAYEAKQYEDAIYAAWERSGFFNPDNLPGDRKETFSIVLPPPNVTGTLHMGHAVMLAVEDVMVRFNRMRGKKTLWLPGTDHAAIATQTKVEKLLMKDGMKDPRGQLGREAFLKRVEEFASASHDTIVNQAKKMGASLDWSREAYTLDAARNRAVNTVFKMMHDDGLIYRGHRLVNWCARCQSTLADDEVEYREEKTKFYYFKYGPVVIGTARPETKFLDKVIVVHPDDARYRDLVGKEFEVEWIEGKVKAKVIADAASEMEMGTGAMTITPAHSFVDFDLAKKYGFEVVQIIGENGKLTEAAGSFAGQDAHEAREAIVEKLAANGLVDHIDENYVHNLSVCYRCESPVEPLPKLQWFIDVNKLFTFRASSNAAIGGIKDGEQVTLKSLMSYVVRSEQIRIIPDRFKKTYFHWIDNLRDWNISRQIWFGHRVPVWYRSIPPLPDLSAEALAKAEGGLGGVGVQSELFVGVQPPQGEGWVQDSDTLDTWFSAGLWTFSTLGWPDKTQDLRTFHPTSVLETGYDIIFFWVARMILMTTYALGEIPFKTVYLHGLVRDERGRKMSKSLDNVIDPLDMIKLYGADATRLSLVIGSTPGNDSKLSEAKVAGYRNFTNKLWNISRFVLSSVDRDATKVAKNPEPHTLTDRWILSRLASLQLEVTKHLEAYEFSQAGEKLRDFTWGEFADWYLEIAKIQRLDSTDAILLYILENLLVLWHPFMPFVTEEIWKHFSVPPLPEGGLGGVGVPVLLMIHPWPAPALDHHDLAVESAFDRVQSLIVAIRNIRSIHKLPPKVRVDVTIVGAIPDGQEEIIRSLAGVGELTFAHQAPHADGFASAVVDDVQIYVSLAGLVDKQKEEAKLRAQATELKAYLDSLTVKLANTEFLSKAPPAVVASMRQKLSEAETKLRVIQSQLSS